MSPPSIDNRTVLLEKLSNYKEGTTRARNVLLVSQTESTKEHTRNNDHHLDHQLSPFSDKVSLFQFNFVFASQIRNRCLNFSFSCSQHVSALRKLNLNALGNGFTNGPLSLKWTVTWLKAKPGHQNLWNKIERYNRRGNQNLSDRRMILFSLWSLHRPLTRISCQIFLDDNEHNFRAHQSCRLWLLPLPLLRWKTLNDCEYDTEKCVKETSTEIFGDLRDFLLKTQQQPCSSRRWEPLEMPFSSYVSIDMNLVVKSERMKENLTQLSVFASSLVSWLPQLLPWLHSLLSRMTSSDGESEQ
jgi:hypothetical protein